MKIGMESKIAIDSRREFWLRLGHLIAGHDYNKRVNHSGKDKGPFATLYCKCGASVSVDWFGNRL